MTDTSTPRRGRPPKAAHEKAEHKPGTYVRLDVSTRRQLEELAEARQVSVSEVCREFILAGLNPGA